MYDKHCESRLFNVTRTASKHWSKQPQGCRSRRPTVAANSFTNKCKASWRGSPSGLIHQKTIQSSLQNSNASSTLDIQHNKQSRPLPSAIHHQNYRLQNAWTPRPRKARTLRDWAMREIEPIMLRLQHDGRQRRLNYRFASFIPCLFRKQPVDFAPLKVVYDGRHSLALHAILQQKVRTHGHLP